MPLCLLVLWPFYISLLAQLYVATFKSVGSVAFSITARDLLFISLW